MLEDSLFELLKRFSVSSERLVVLRCHGERNYAFSIENGLLDQTIAAKNYSKKLNQLNVGIQAEHPNMANRIGFTIFKIKNESNAT